MPEAARPERPGRAGPARWLVRFGYDGTGFAGWARQPRLRTVEGTIRDGLLRAGIIARGAPPASLDVASRTDRGVHARGNALALVARTPATSLLRALNGIAPDIWFTHLRAIDDAFRPREALRRVYRYYAPGAQIDLDAWRSAADRLVGPLDGRSFGRGLPRATPAFRTIERLRVDRVGGLVEVEVVARSFVWGMVRKIVAALGEVGDSRLSLRDLERGAQGELRLALPMAPAAGLILWEVEYPGHWEHGPALDVPRQLEARREALEQLQVRAAVLAALEGGARGPGTATAPAEL